MKKTEDTRLRDCRKCPFSGLTSHCWGIFPSTLNRRRQAEPAGARKVHSATVLGSRKSSARLRAFRDLGSSGRLGSEGGPRSCLNRWTARSFARSTRRARSAQSVSSVSRPGGRPAVAWVGSVAPCRLTGLTRPVASRPILVGRPSVG